MQTRKYLLVLFAFLMLLAQPSWVPACPSCAEAPVAGGNADEEQSPNNGRAYNHSIYIMVGIPYACLAVVGLFIYRGVKKNEEFRLTEDHSANNAST